MNRNKIKSSPPKRKPPARPLPQPPVGAAKPLPPTPARPPAKPLPPTPARPPAKPLPPTPVRPPAKPLPRPPAQAVKPLPPIPGRPPVPTRTAARKPLPPIPAKPPVARVKPLPPTPVKVIKPPKPLPPTPAKPVVPPLDLSVVRPTSDQLASPRVTRPGARMLPDQARYRLNDNRDRKFVGELYKRWYDGASGDRRSGTDADTWEDVYGLMGVGSAGYLKQAIGVMDVWDFAQQGRTDGYVVENQGAEDDPPVEFWRGLSGGDYFRVLKTPSGSLSAEDVRNRSRRLIVNLNSQEAGLRVAKALTPLFKDPDLGDNFSQFKVYLSSTAYPDRPVKNDKMVVYYLVGEDADGSGADAVGDKLISTIDGAIRPGDANIGVSPFYSRLTAAVSWAEEAEEYLSVEERQSFTESRAKVIASVLQDHPNVRDAAELETLIKKAFQDKGILAEARHRHMPPPPPAT